MKKKILIIIFLLFALNVEAIESKTFLKLMPPDTELLSQEESGSQGSVFSVTCKYKSQKDKEEIVDFYKNFLKDSDFQELKNDISEKDSTDPGIAHIFKNQNQLILLVVMKQPQEGFTIYYVSLSESR